MSRAGRGAVVVAVDGAGTARDAVEWASSEAAARGCPLRIVHAHRPPWPAGLGPTVPSPESIRMLRTEIDGILAAEVARARAVASDLEVSATQVQGPPVRALLAAAAGAGLLVVGSRTRPGLRGLLTRSMSIGLIAHAPCPVVVVRPAPAGGDRDLSPPRVVVGVDDTASGREAVGFAFRAARQRGVPLVAVRAWAPDRPADLEGASGSPVLAEAFARRTLERVLDHLHGDFPDVPVHALVAQGEPAQALATRTEGAAMAVVGSRGLGHLRGTLLGSVSQAVLQHTRCPLAVVGNGWAGRASTDHVRGADGFGPAEERRDRRRPA
ncbi:universal stress protein [Pseudonocardia parietis]|uniref:Nucleotide-binding universal stress UspA family protein n=1 Tax=Pseudonocardia parietis TaxID=570936 RepID=A0ABS4VQ80_9PSEU|nr:universal stress protein [Pseudonocardia parietis]MBP2366080.1 nucleotide-binding universal stress UspA family protein [Pseudonocardia parietis]